MIFSAGIFLLALLWIFERLKRGSSRPYDLNDFGWAAGYLVGMPFPWLLDCVSDAGGWLNALGFYFLNELVQYSYHRFVLHGHAWPIHIVHHSYSMMGVLGTFRANALERLVAGLLLAGCCWAAGPSSLGLAVCILFTLLVQANAHTDAYKAGWLDCVFIVSARSHTAHHWAGRRCNFGHSTTIFDRLLGSHVVPTLTTDNCERVGPGGVCY